MDMTILSRVSVSYLDGYNETEQGGDELTLMDTTTPSRVG